MESIQSSDGTAIAFARAGLGPPLVLVHGAACDHSVWFSVLPLLTRHFTVYALDRRGRGASGDTAPYAVEREVEDIVAVLESTGQRCHLLGHSSGAVLALEVASRGQLLQRLVLYEPPLFVGGQRPRPGQEWAERLAALVVAGQRDAALRTFLHEGPGTPDALMNQMQASASWARMTALAHTLPYDAQIAVEFSPDRVRLQPPLVPTLLMLGGASAHWVHADGEILAALLPDSRVALLPGQEHTAMVAAPAMFASAVAQFLTEAEPELS